MCLRLPPVRQRGSGRAPGTRPGIRRPPSVSGSLAALIIGAARLAARSSPGRLAREKAYRPASPAHRVLPPRPWRPAHTAASALPAAAPPAMNGQGARRECERVRTGVSSASGAGHMPGFTFISAVGARGSVQENPGRVNAMGRPPLAREPATVRSGRRGRSWSVRQEASCLWEFVSRVVGKTPDPLSVNELHEDLYTLRWAASNFATERVHVTGRRYSRKFNYLISNNFFVSVKDCQQLKTPLNHRGLLVVLGDLFTDFSTDFVESGGAAQAVNELVHESPTPHEMGARSGAERRGGSGARLPRFLAPRPVFGPAGRR